MIPEFFVTLVTGITCLGWDGIIKIAAALGFINTFLSLAITQTFSRKAFISKRWALLLILVLLWSIVVGVLADTLLRAFIPAWPFWCTTAGIILWILGLFLFLWTLFEIFAVDQICYTITCSLGKGETFEKFPTSFSRSGELTCLDEKIQDTNHPFRDTADPYKYPWYPIILVADESWRPWCIAEDFSVNALLEGAGVIWFWFSRPYHPEPLRQKLRASNRDLVHPAIIHVDCFDPGKNLNKNAGSSLNCLICKARSGCGSISEWVKTKWGRCPVDNVLYADPRNPDDIDCQYSRAVNLMREKLKKTKLCVVFDPVSDFLYFSDIEMASRYLRVTMAWEEKNNVHSLYLMRTGVLDPKLEQYIQWYASTVVTLKAENGTQKMVVRGLEKVPRTYDIDYEMTCRNTEPDEDHL